MGYSSNLMVEQDELDSFIDGLIWGHNDPCYLAPKGKYAEMTLYEKPYIKALSVEGMMYDYPNSANALKHVFVPNHNPHKYMVFAANDNDTDVGYHGLTTDDL